MLNYYITYNIQFFLICVYYMLHRTIYHPKELLYHIDNHVQNENNKKQFGEVFTPMSLVNEMLDKLPVHVWTDPNLKWLDPCVGMGNFMIAVYLRLIESLIIIKDIDRRKKHILENMLYMVELNKKNVYITKQIFDINNEYKLNIACADSLTLNYVKRFKTDTFDIIVGNPPYQETTETGATKGGTNLYTKFINIGFSMLTPNGHLLYITPISWLNASKNIQSGNDILHNIMLKYDLLYLNLNECKKYFNIGSTFSYFLVRNKITKNIVTKIISQYLKKVEHSNIDMKKYYELEFLPIHITKQTIELIHNVINKSNKLKIERCRKLDTSTKYGKLHLKLTKDEKFRYKTFHTTTKTYYSDIKLDNYDDIKILLNMAGYLKPSICKKCNVTESKFYVTVTNLDEANTIIDLLTSPEIIEYLELCKYSGFNSRPVLESISY